MQQSACCRHVLPHFQLWNGGRSPMKRLMSFRTHIRYAASLSVALVMTMPALAQQAPSRISWAPSYSGSCIDCSLQGRNMSGWNISKANYPGADLTAAKLRGVHAHDANFNNVQAAGADFRLSDFTDSSFEGAVLIGASLQGTSFNGSKMEGVILTGATLDNGQYIGTNLTGAQLQSSVHA